ncbi:MAG: TonB-dependent receptor, partial [Novosphingobium sp.]|nr:TonB-dependent receptor [Novosphingobium sp.]
MRTKYLLLTATAFGLVVPSTAALAQDRGEIVVTARKQQESILKVPVVVTALGTEQIERAQIKDIVDIAKKTTGLQLGIAATETGTLISLRGYGTTALDPGVDQSVSLNLDGMQITQGMAYSVGFFDMAQVEVLKGPQALFFGKASPAGVVSIRTADPGDEWEIIGKSGYEFVANEWRNELILSGPLSDSLGIRLAGMYDDYGGFFKNVATPKQGGLAMPERFGATKTLFLRGTLLFDDGGPFTARIKANYTRDKQHGAQPGQLYGCHEGTENFLANVFGLPFESFFSDNEDCKVNRKLSIVGMDPAAYPAHRDRLDGGRPASYIWQKFGTLELNYDVMPDLTVTSLTGYYKLKADVDFNCFFAGGAGPTCMTAKRFKRQEFTQELRMASDFSGPLNFTLGGFYQDGKITDDEILPANTAIFSAIGSPATIFFDGTQRVDIETISLFGQLRFKPVDQLEIAGGVRWTDEKRRSSPTTVNLATGMNFDDALIAQPDLRSKTWSPEATITYTPTDDLTFFASAKQAYKSGSYNLITPVQPGEDRSFGDEKIRGVEVGMKARLADRQVNFNLAGYYYKVSDMQVGVNLPVAGGVPVLVTFNAGKAKIYGLEADFSYRPDSIDGLEIHGAVNYNHARFTEFVGAPCLGGQTFEQGCNLDPAPVDLSNPLTAFPSIAFTDPALFDGAPFRYNSTDLSGSRLPKAPDWSGNIGVYYEMPVGDEMTLGLGTDAQFSSKYLGNLGVFEDFFQKAYAKINANVTLKGKNDAWEVAFIGNNLTNKLTLGSASSANYAGGLFFGGVVTGGP